MNLPRDFEEYVQEGIIRKCSVNKSRAMFLVSESQKSLTTEYATQVVAFTRRIYPKLKKMVE